MGDIVDQVAAGQTPTPSAPPSAPSPQGDIVDQVAAGSNNTQPSAGAPKTPAVDQASQDRQMLVSGLTGMPTPNMNEQDRQNFAAGKAAGAVSVPLVASATAGGVAALNYLAPIAEHISGQILEHGTELATKYPNFVKLAGKLIPGLPVSTLAALTYAYEKLKK